MSPLLPVRMKTFALALMLAVACAPVCAQEDAQAGIKRGEYLSKAAGCLGCHTDEKKDAIPYAGGRALKTPFGTFYGPNITRHPQAGIGKWTEAEFMQACVMASAPTALIIFPPFRTRRLPP